MQYFKELYPEMKVTGYCDKYVKKLKRAEIDVNLVWLEKRLGKHLTNDEIQGKLEKLGFDVQINGEDMHVIAPTWRSTGDISIKDDVMEEVARMYGTTISSQHHLQQHLTAQSIRKIRIL